MDTKLGASQTDEHNDNDLLEEVSDPGEGKAATQVSPSGEKGELAPVGANGMEGLEGDIDRDDLVIPYFSLVGKTGQLSDHFTPGSFVFNKEHVLSDGKEPLLITALSLKKSWVEDIDFDPEIMPKRWDNLADAMEEGYSKEWGAEKRVVPQAAILLLVPISSEYASFEAPKHLHQVLTEQAQRVFRGEPVFGFARALYICQGGAYNAVAKPLITATTSGHLRGGVHHGAWTITSYLRSNNKNSWYAPKLAAAGKHSPEFVKWLEEEVIF